MNLPILILFTFILNILFSMTSSIVSTNKEIEDESYKYQATLKWLSLCMEVFGTLMSVIYLQSLIHGPLLYVVVLLLVYVYILLSDLLPRKIANAHLDQFEKPFMSIAKGIQSLFTPFTFFLRFQVEKEQEDYSEEDIYEVINGGGVEPSQKEFIENLFEFDDTPVEEICTHRSEVVCLYLNDDKETWKKTILENRHTLYPVCDEDNDDVVGILDTRDYFRLDSIEQDNVINKAMDQPFFISQNMKADVLLKEMKIKKVYFAVLLDEYGGMTGIVTLHDIIENLTDEEKEMEFYDDEGNKIVDKLIKQFIKDADVELETRKKLRNYNSLVTKKKELNKALKSEIAELELNTKSTIENLTYEQIDDSLNSKWIEPLMQSINSLPIKLLNDFETKIDLLSKKYETTYSDLEEEISKTEKSLISMLDDLEGNDFDMLGLDEFKTLLGGK